MLQNNGLFSGLPGEDPYLHLVNFLETCDSHKQNGVTPEALQLRLFKHSLQGNARQWLMSQAPHSISSWAQLSQLFMNTYSSPTKDEKIRKEIHNFFQENGEVLFEAWERFKMLLRRCPNHGVETWRQVHIFYQGLNENSRTVLDAAAGGNFMSQTIANAFALLDQISQNRYTKPTERTVSGTAKVPGVLELDSTTAIQAQLAALAKQNQLIQQQLAALLKPQQVHVIQAPDGFPCCENCGGNHYTNQCQADLETLNYVNNGPRQFANNNNNQGWQAPQFGGNQQGYGFARSQGQFQQFQQRPPQQEFPIGNQVPSTIEELGILFSQFATTTQAAIRNLEIQVGQIASEKSTRPSGALPSNTEDPRKNINEQCNAVSLRNGRQLEEAPRKTRPNKEETKLGEEEEEKVKKSVPPAFMPVPYPQRLQRPKLDAQFQAFFNHLKKVQINIPLVEILENSPKWATFMKDILSKKRKIEEHEIVALTDQCSAILQSVIPPKRQDPGSCTIPCTIGTQHFKRALCDQGSSVNLMPYSVYKKLKIGELKPKAVTLQLANRSLVYARGVVEDILVKVDKFILPADFVVLDIDEDDHVPIILGRPFLATGGAIIDVGKRELTLNVGDETLTLKVYQEEEPPRPIERCAMLEEVSSSNFITVQLHKSIHASETNMYVGEHEKRKESVALKSSNTLRDIKPKKIVKEKAESPPKRPIWKKKRINPCIQDLVKREVLKWVRKIRN